MIVYATKTQWYNPAYTWNLIFHGLIITAWKVPKYGVISGPYFPIFGLNRERYGVFSPNTGKYGPEITPHLATFHAVIPKSIKERVPTWGEL